MAKHEALFVRYCAKDFLDGTQMLPPLAELAYRRICDLIYDSGNRVRDDDKYMAWFTKTGKQWPRIKAILLAASGPASEGASGKIYIEQGFIRNNRCSTEIDFVSSKRIAGRFGGRATQKGPNSSNSLQNLKQYPKQRPKHHTEAETEAPSEANHLTTEPKKENPNYVGSKESRSRKAQIAPEWRPSEAGFAYALDKAGWPQARATEEAEHFRDHHRSKANTFADADAAWRTWVRNSLKFASNGNGAMSGHAHQPYDPIRGTALNPPLRQKHDETLDDFIARRDKDAKIRTDFPQTVRAW